MIGRQRQQNEKYDEFVRHRRQGKCFKLMKLKDLNKNNRSIILKDFES